MLFNAIMQIEINKGDKKYVLNNRKNRLRKYITEF